MTNIDKKIYMEKILIDVFGFSNFKNIVYNGDYNNSKTKLIYILNGIKNKGRYDILEKKWDEIIKIEIKYNDLLNYFNQILNEKLENDIILTQ